MGARILGLSALSSLALFVVPVIFGCDAAGKPTTDATAKTTGKPTIEELKANVDKLSNQVELMSKNDAGGITKVDLEALRKDLNDALVDWAKKELPKLQAELASKVSQAELDAMAEKFDAALKATRARQAELRQTVEQMAKSDNTQRRVQANRTSADSGKSTGGELARTVRKSVSENPTTGKLHVENSMPDRVLLRVNGADYWVEGGRVTDFIVPVGNVTTELVNFEPVQTRTVGAPDFSTTMTIRPKTVASP